MMIVNHVRLSWRVERQVLHQQKVHFLNREGKPVKLGWLMQVSSSQLMQVYATRKAELSTSCSMLHVAPRAKGQQAERPTGKGPKGKMGCRYHDLHFCRVVSQLTTTFTFHFRRLLQTDIHLCCASLASGVHTPTTSYFTLLRLIDDTCRFV